MATYYEQLNLSPQATAAEIESAIDALYNAWRQGATHPDAVVVEEVNRNLRVLEQMRVTLSDPDRRAAYDAGIGLGEASGLVDPAAVLRPKGLPRQGMKAQPQTGVRETLWTCPECKTDNPEWTQYCFNCRTELIRRCPECGQVKSLVKTGVCGNCGFAYDVAKQRAEYRRELEIIKSAPESTKQTVVVLLWVAGWIVILYGKRCESPDCQSRT